MNIKGVLFISKDWKLIVHLLLKTKRFGVNNKWSSSFDSILSDWTMRRRIINILKVKPIIFNYRLVKIRARDLGFLHPDTCRDLGWKRDR